MPDDGEGTKQRKKCLFYPYPKYKCCYHCGKPPLKQRCLLKDYRDVDYDDELENPREPTDARTVMDEWEQERWNFLKKHRTTKRGSGNADSGKRERKPKEAKAPKEKKPVKEGKSRSKTSKNADSKEPARKKQKTVKVCDMLCGGHRALGAFGV